MPPKLPEFKGLTDYDFNLFTKEKWRSDSYDAARLAVKRKLAAIGKHIEADYKRDKVPLTHKTSTHNPNKYNSNQVRMLKMYFARSKAARKPLRDLLGEALAGDLDPHYCNTQVWVKVEAGHIEFACAIHPAAWWDAQHFVKACQTADGRRAFCEALHGLPREEYLLQIGNLGDHLVDDLRQDELERILKHYTAGEDWIRVYRRYPAEAVVEEGPEFLETARRELTELLSVYERFAWQL